MAISNDLTFSALVFQAVTAGGQMQPVSTPTPSTTGTAMAKGTAFAQPGVLSD